MTAIAIKSPSMSTGHGGWCPVTASNGFSTTAFINGVEVQLVGMTQYNVHTFDDISHPHDGAEHIVTTGSSSLIIENKKATMVGEMMDCGDMIAVGSHNAFIQ